VKAVILAGGLGTRLAEETDVRPKPMVEIGDRPILWHIMQIFAHYGIREFVVALGYKGEVVKDYFLRHQRLNGDMTIDLASGTVTREGNGVVDWQVSLVDTGFSTMTGGRLKRVENTVRDSGTFILTYGDGVANVNVCALVAFHRAHGRLATITAVRPPARFGTMTFDGDRVIEFQEKPQLGEGWINGGFFVMEPGVFEYLDGDACVLEGEPLERLARDGELMAYRHDGFWQCMDTLRDKRRLEEMWAQGCAPWKIWL